MQDFQLDEKRRQQLDANIRSMLEGGASEDDVMRYASDFKNQFGKKKAQSDSIPTVEISQDVLKTGFVPQSSVPSSGTISPLEIPRPQGQSEKVRVEAAPKPKETKYGGSGVLNIGEPYTSKPSERVQKLIEAGGAFKPETKEKDLIRRSIEKGSLQGELANALPIDSKPNAEQLKKIANINKKMASLPQSDAEKAFQKDGFGVFKKDPLLGAEYLLETIISSGAALFESGKRTAGAGIVTGAVGGSVVPGIGTLSGAATGLTAGLSAGGVNLSTSSKIMELLNESGIDISDEDSLIAAFSDEKKMAQLRKKAADYALPIFYFDLAAAGLAGRFANKAVGKSVGKKVLAATKEVGLQSAAGSAGELTGQLASGQKVNWSDVAMEGIASIATDAPELVRPIGSLVVGRKNASSNNKTIVKQVVNLGEEVGKQDAVENLKRDLNNGVINEEEYKQGLEVVEKAAEVAKNVPPDLSPKEKVEIIQSVVEDREPDFGMGDVTDDEYNVFIDKGIVTEERLNDIAKKVKEQDQLDEREKAIFTSYTGQINDIIAQQEALEETQPQPIQPEEQITTEEQFKEPLVETVEPTQQEILNDVKNKNFTTVEYGSESEIPSVWKNKVSSVSEVNGKKVYKITLPTSQFEYESKTGVSKNVNEYPLGRKQGVETVEQESQVIPLQEQQKSQDITLQKEDWSKDVESTAKALEMLDNNFEETGKLIDAIRETASKEEKERIQKISERKIPKGDKRWNEKNFKTYEEAKSFADKKEKEGATIFSLTQKEQPFLSKEEMERKGYTVEYHYNPFIEKAISEAYHKAKADGSNPELVKAVEDLLGKPKEKVEPPVQVKEEEVVEAPVSETKQAEPTKSIKDKFKDIADINLSDNPEVVKKREVTKYLKDNPEIAEVVKNFRKITDYLEAQGELKKSSPNC